MILLTCFSKVLPEFKDVNTGLDLRLGFVDRSGPYFGPGLSWFQPAGDFAFNEALMM